MRYTPACECAILQCGAAMRSMPAWEMRWLSAQGKLLIYCACMRSYYILIGFMDLT